MRNSILIWALLVLLTGCQQVLTYYPLYNEKDLIANHNLLGVWIDQDSVLWKLDLKIGDNGTVDSTVYVLSKAFEDSSTVVWGSTDIEAHLLKIKNCTFIDLTVEEIDDNGLREEKLFPFFVAPFHRYAKMEIKNDSVSLFWPDPIWMGKMAMNKKLRLDYDIKGIEAIDGGDREMTVYIFSKTDKLRKFVTKYVNNKEAFVEYPSIFVRYYLR